MKRVDDYINSVYKISRCNNNEINDLKAEMKNHLIEVIEDLKKDGYTEDESISIALERFGNKHQISGEVTQLFNIKRDNLKDLLLLSLTIIPLILTLRALTGITTFYPITVPILLTPIYCVYEFMLIFNNHRKKIPINKMHEFIKFCFIFYLLILSGKILFPINSYIDFTSSHLPMINIIPLKSIIEFIKAGSYSIIKLGLFFVPLGFLAPILSDKFKIIKSNVVLAFLIFVLNSIITLCKSILGTQVATGFITIDYLIIYVCGTLLGYCIYIILMKYVKLDILNS